MIRPNGRTPVKQRMTSLTPSIIERVVCALLGFTSAISAASFIDSQLSRQRQLSQSIFIIKPGVVSTLAPAAFAN
jgi:hypothetical protein